MPWDYLDKIFKVMKETPQHIYQVLTKRAEIMYEYLKDKEIPANVWLGVTVENDKRKYRIDYLRKLPAKVRFISFEPLLSDIKDLDLTGIHWAIVGGESGPKARPMRKEWVLNIKEQCEKYNVAFFFKQWGTWGEDGVKRNKKANGRKLAGKIYDQMPV